MSILLSYIRLFGLNYTWLRTITFAAMAYTIGWAVAYFLVIILQWYVESRIKDLLQTVKKSNSAQSRPTSYYWDQVHFGSNAKGVCTVSPQLTPVVTSALNTAGDIVVLCIPIFTLNKLRLKRKKKIALISVFCLGGL